jgi:hypothetical protein
MPDRAPEDFVFSLLREDPPVDELNKYAGIFKEDDWQEVVKFTSSHSLFPAFYDRLVRMKISHVPEDILSHLKGMYLLNLKRNMFLEDELFNVLDHLKSCNIPAIPLKGTALAGYIYKNIALRQAPCDMDILVPEDKLEEAEKNLKELGYLFLYEAHFNEVERKFQKMGYSFEHNQCMINILHKYRSEVSLKKELHGFNLHIDLHWTFRDKFVNIDIKDFWRNVNDFDLNGHKILLPSLEVIFYHLMIVSIARYDFVSIKNIYDIYKLITHYREDINWENMLDRVKRNKLNHLLYFVLIITEELFKVSVPEYVIKELKPGTVKENFLKKWLNKDTILKQGGEIASSYIWRLFVVNILYSMSFLSTFNMIYRRICFPIYEGLELLFKQKHSVKC